MVALSRGFCCDRSPGRGLITLATNSSQPALPAVDITFGTKTSTSFTGTISGGPNVTASVGYTLLVFVYAHDADIVSLSAASGIGAGFGLRGTAGVSGSVLKFYTGYVTSAMVGVAVTATLSTAAGAAAASVGVLPIIGAYDPLMPFFDPNVLVPDLNGPDTAIGQNAVISSTNAKALLVYACGSKGPLVNLTDPAGWTAQLNTGFVLADLLIATKFVTTAQSVLAVAAGVSDAHDTCSIGDAINGIY